MNLYHSVVLDIHSSVMPDFHKRKKLPRSAGSINAQGLMKND
jgi:hypothetical protein